MARFRTKKWLIISSIFLLVVSFALIWFLGFGLTPDPGDTTPFTGAWYGPQGVVLFDTEGLLGKSFVVKIEPAFDAREEIPFPEYLAGVRPASPFLALSSSEEFLATDDRYLVLAFPVPEGSDPANLAVAVLTPPDMIIAYEETEGDAFAQWDIILGAYDAQAGYFAVPISYISTTPRTLVMVQGPDFFFQRNIWDLPGHEFSVVSVGFAEDGCSEENRSLIEEELNTAYRFWKSAGFREPNLRKVLVDTYDHEGALLTSEELFEYQLRKASSPNGAYVLSERIAYTEYWGVPETPERRTSRHELFHAFQYAYEEVSESRYLEDNRKRVYRGIIEGTAVASEWSYNGLRRSNAAYSFSSGEERRLTSRNPLPITTSILRTNSSAESRDYQTQDFFVYIGMRMQPTEPKSNFLLLFFETAQDREAIEQAMREDPDIPYTSNLWLGILDAALRREGTFASLQDAYWQWAKNQSFEKSVILGPDHDGNPIPHGAPGEWSGHGTVPRETTFNITSWIREEGVGISKWTRTWSSSGPDPFSCSVSRLIFAPAEGYEYYVTMEVELPESGPAFRYKFYDEGDTNRFFIRDEGRDDSPHTVTVRDEPVTVYFLMANTKLNNMTGRILMRMEKRILREIHSTPPPFPTPSPPPVMHSLEVRASVPLPLPKDPPYISSQTGHAGTVNYTLSAAEGTQVQLEAPQHIGSGASRKTFAGWSGSVTSDQRAITFSIDRPKTVTANYANAPVLPAYTLTVRGLYLEDLLAVSIASTTGHHGQTEYAIPNITQGTTVHLQAPQFVGEGKDRKEFSHWSGDVSGKERNIQWNIASNQTVTAHYASSPESASFQLTVNSKEVKGKLDLGVKIASESGHGGTTKYIIEKIPQGTVIYLEAPQTIGTGIKQKTFKFWALDEKVLDKNRIAFPMDSDKAVWAHYE